MGVNKTVIEDNSKPPLLTKAKSVTKKTKKRKSKSVKGRKTVIEERPVTNIIVPNA